MSYRTYEDSLYHHGVKGQKWGVRRYQNKDGSLTSAGKRRYASSSDAISVDSKKDSYKIAGMPEIEVNRHTYSSKGSGKQAKEIDKMAEENAYDEAINKYDQIGFNVIEAYQKEGKEAVENILSKELKGAQFKFTISDEKELVENGEKYLGFYMTVYGKNFSYTTQGSGDYSDDQRFERYKSDG